MLQKMYNTVPKQLLAETNRLSGQSKASRSVTVESPCRPLAGEMNINQVVEAAVVL